MYLSPCQDDSAGCHKVAQDNYPRGKRKEMWSGPTLEVTSRRLGSARCICVLGLSLHPCTTHAQGREAAGKTQSDKAVRGIAITSPEQQA